MAGTCCGKPITRIINAAEFEARETDDEVLKVFRRVRNEIGREFSALYLQIVSGTEGTVQ